MGQSIINSKPFFASRGSSELNLKQLLVIIELYYLFVHSANTVHVPGTPLDTENTSMKTIDKDPCLMLITF